MSYSTALYARVKEYLDADQLHYEESPEEGRFEFGISIRSKVRSIHVVIVVFDADVRVSAYPQFGGDPKDAENMRALAEFTAMVNYGLVQGRFDLDFRDGEIRYWSALLTDESSLPSVDVIARVVWMPIWMWERFGDGYLQVGLAGADPAAVRAAIDAQETAAEQPEEPTDSEIV